jgi:hypothetical protein
MLRVRRVISRARTGQRYFEESIKQLLMWVFKDTEDSNFYYDLKPRNEEYLSSLISNITGEKSQVVQEYINEIKSNQALSSRLQRSLIKSGYPSKIEVRFGRRVGWYAMIRIMKPKVVVETGVDHGVGLSVICEALKLNRLEGYSGRYFGTDNNPLAGQLSSSEYNDFAHILYGDSIESLSAFDKTIDFFINDSDHSADYESAEYDAILEKLSKDAIILGDNSHVTNKLLIFSNLHDRAFYFFKEEPLNHWYPGAGIGISVPGNFTIKKNLRNK